MEDQDADSCCAVRGQRFFSKNIKKLLDKGYVLWYYSQARPSESEGRSEANLENDTERETRNRKETVQRCMVRQRRFQRVNEHESA